MTNEMIILKQSVALAEQGIIKYTDQKIEVTDQDGNKKELYLPEQIHTYAGWKALGFQVKKGSKAVAKFEIWKCASKKVEEKGKDIRTGEVVTEEVETKRMFRKLSYWFTQEQVEAIA